MIKDDIQNILFLAFITVLFVGIVNASSTITNLSENSLDVDVQPHWFVLDPLNEYSIGNLVNISGTTNAPPGSNLTILVAGSCFRNPAGFPCPRIFELNTTTESGTSNINASIFSILVNTSGHEPDRYEIFVFNSGFRGNSSVLTLKAHASLTINPQSENTPYRNASQPAAANMYFIVFQSGSRFYPVYQ